jgi:ubiquinone biosynthesis protein
LLKHEFHDFVEHSKLIHSYQLKKYFFKKHLKKRRVKTHFTHYQRILLAVEELGPTFIKFGQFLSNRPDLIPSELCAEFEKLLEHVPPFNGEEAIKIVEKSLHLKIKNVFKEFDHKPFSSASIAQVHIATLKNGAKVAVKIQRPGIKHIIDSDLEIMFNLAALAKKHVAGTDAIDPISIVEEFKDGIYQELDFGKEILNIEKFSKIFAEEPDLVVPKVYKEYSNKEIITMEFVEGEKFSTYKASDEQINSICEKLANLVLKQIFEIGYFHADPHAGNIIITPDQKICFIDFGLMGLLPPKHKTAMCEIIVGLVDHDPDVTTRAIISLSFNKEVDNRASLEHQTFKIMEHYGYLPIEDINIGHFLRDLLKLLIENHLKVPADIFLLLKALISLEGTVRKIKPNFDMISHIEPFVKKMIYRSRSLYSFFRELYRSSIDYSKFLSELPAELR